MTKSRATRTSPAKPADDSAHPAVGEIPASIFDPIDTAVRRPADCRGAGGITGFASDEIELISDYAADQVHRLSENLKSLRVKMRQQASLVEAITLAFEGALVLAAGAPDSAVGELENAVTEIIGRLRTNQEALAKQEFRLAENLQFQDRLTQELAQLRKIIGYAERGTLPDAEVLQLAAGIELGETRARLLARFGLAAPDEPSAPDQGGDGDDIELF